jgi:hypothetical protein
MADGDLPSEPLKNKKFPAISPLYNRRGAVLVSWTPAGAVLESPGQGEWVTRSAVEFVDVSEEPG